MALLSRSGRIFCGLNISRVIFFTRNLTSVKFGGVTATFPPYDYESKNFMFTDVLPKDYSRKRLNENSKIVCVDGNLSVGKRSFCRRFAEEFDMLYIEPPTPDDIFIDNQYQVDVREINYLLPPHTQFHGLEEFYSNPSRKVGQYQMCLFLRRFQHYQKALLHLLSTGQGVVMSRGPFTDFVHTKALLKLGYIDEHIYKWINTFYEQTLQQLWKPHLVIYLEAETDRVLENVMKSAKYGEDKSSAMNLKFIDQVESIYREDVFPYFEKHSMLVRYNHDAVQTEADWSLIREDMDCLDLEAEPLGLFQRTQMADWCWTEERTWTQQRKLMMDVDLILLQFSKYKPSPDCMDMSRKTGEGYYHLNNLYRALPMRYKPTYNPKLWSFFDVFLGNMIATKDARALRKKVKYDVVKPLFQPRFYMGDNFEP